MANHNASDTRSPLPAPPLRNPGQSLDEKIYRIINEGASGDIRVAALLLAITVMEWFRWWLNLPLLGLCGVVVRYPIAPRSRPSASG